MRRPKKPPPKPASLVNWLLGDRQPMPGNNLTNMLQTELIHEILDQVKAESPWLRQRRPDSRRLRQALAAHGETRTEAGRSEMRQGSHVYETGR